MKEQGSSSEYRLKLKQGDFVQVTIAGLSGDEVRVDASSWSNVESAALVEVGDNTSIAPGEKVYAEVRKVQDQSAMLVQKRGVYRRNHLPGDEVRLRAVESVSSSLSRAELEQFRNLETVYVVGVSVGADVTGRVAKIRAGTAVVIPLEIHDPGLSAGREVPVRTRAGAQQADVVEKNERSGNDDVLNVGFSVQLAEVAKATGTATVRVTGPNDDEISAEVVEYSEQLPSPGDRVETTVEHGQTHSQVEIGDSGLQIKVQFEHPCPGRGTALIELGEQSSGIFDAKIQEYTDPSIQTNNRYDATIYQVRGIAKIHTDGREVPVQLIDDPSATGKGVVEVVEISESIHGKVVGDIEAVAVDEVGSDVDMTNLSKF